MYMMDTRDILPDPCDNRLIRFNNCIQLLACICEIAAAFDKNLKDFVMILDLVADCTFCTMAACMHAQTDLELKAAVLKPNYGVELKPKCGGAPAGQQMRRQSQNQNAGNYDDRSYENQSLVSHQNGYPQSDNAEC
jgi:hypothetical protein